MLLHISDGIIVQDCIEPSEDMARIAKMRGLNVQTATAETAELEADVYDLIYFNGSSSCIDDLESSCYATTHSTPIRLSRMFVRAVKKAAM